MIFDDGCICVKRGRYFPGEPELGYGLFVTFSLLPLSYGLIQEEVEFALRSCCNRDPSILYQSSVRGESGLGARAAASTVVCCQQEGREGRGALEVWRECFVGAGW